MRVPGWSKSNVSAALVVLASLLGISDARSSVLEPNLIVASVDDAGVVHDCESGALSGTLEAVVANVGTATAPSGLRVVFFEDRDRDGSWDPAVDGLLGEAFTTAALTTPDPTSSHVETVSGPVSGAVAFRGRRICAHVDADDAVPSELDETDNVGCPLRTADVPAGGSFWDTGLRYQALPGVPLNVEAVVGHLTDDDGDGLIGPGDVPDIVTKLSFSGTEPLAVLDGATGQVQFETAPGYVFEHAPALGDIDGDGLPEIVAVET